MGKIKSHKKDIQSLETKDPEFYKFLQENDQQILNFGNDDEDEDEDDEEDHEQDEEFEVLDYDDVDNDDEVDDDDMVPHDKKKSKQSKSSSKKNENSHKTPGGGIEITNEMLDNVVAKVISPSSNSNAFSSLKKLLSYFRAACIPNTDNDDNEQEDDEDEEENFKTPNNKYIVASPDVYNNIMIKVLENAHIGFHYLFQNTDTYGTDDTTNPSSHSLHDMDKHPKWKKYQTLIVGFFKSIMSTLSTFQYLTNETESTPESSGPGQIGAFLITSLQEYLFLLANLPRLARSVQKLLLGIWSQDLSLISDTSKIREAAFLRLFHMCHVLPDLVVEDVFKQTYLVFAKKCRSYNETNSTSVQFMTECFTQLYGTNTQHAYQQGFLYIRQLALHLRAHLIKKGSAVANESAKVVYSWQYLNCLKLWTRVLCTYPRTDDQLGALIFPLTQIILGTVTVCYITVLNIFAACILVYDLYSYFVWYSNIYICLSSTFHISVCQGLCRLFNRHTTCR